MGAGGVFGGVGGGLLGTLLVGEEKADRGMSEMCWTIVFVFVA